MHTPNLIDDLCDTQVDDQACQTEGLLPREAVELAHEGEHRLQRDHHGFVEILVEAKGDPSGGGTRTRGRQMEICVVNIRQ